MIPQGDVFFIRAVRPPVYISYLLNELVEDIEQRFFTYLPHLIQFVFVGAVDSAYEPPDEGDG